MTWLLCIITMILSLAIRPAWSANTHGSSNELLERQHWFGDMFSPHVSTGCLPSVPAASLTLAAFACQAYVQTADGALAYVTQTAQAVGPLSGGDGTYWLAVHRDNRTAVAGWTRQAGTHYLWQKAATQPADPANTLVVAQITVASGAISATEGVGRYAAVGGRGTVYARNFASVNAAIEALPMTGGTVYLECGTHTITQTLNLGTGDPGVVSKRHGVKLKGASPLYHAKDRSCAVLQWAGGAAAMVAVRGPLSGWGIEDVYLDGGGTATSGIYVQSAQGGDVRNVTIANYNGIGIQSTCVPTFAGWPGVTDSLHNNWYNVWVWHLPPAPAGSAGVSLHSNDITCNTDFNNFYGLTVTIAGVDGWGIYIGGSDHNMFFNAHIIDDATTRSGVHFAYDASPFAGWPCGNNFYGLSLGEKGMSASGAPLADNTCSNSIFGLTGGDPANYVPDLPGVTAVYGDRVSQDLMLIAGRGSNNSKPVGDVTVYTHASFPRNFIPLVDGLSDLGRKTGPSGAQRWKDVHLLGHVIRNQRGVTGDTTLDNLTDYYLQVGNAGGATTITLQDAVAACGREYVIRNLTVNDVILDPVVVGQTVEGANTFTFNTSPKSVRLTSDCLNWWITSAY
jgi:hypothetical protein